MSITARIDRITGIPAMARRPDPPCPPSAKIELTARCDLACFFCASSGGWRQRGDMDWDFYLRLLDDLKAAGVEEVGLFYLGESMLYRRLPEAVAAARRAGFPYVFLTTNGRMATPGRLGPLFEAGLDSLKFSFNFADAEDCRARAGVDAFAQIRVNLAAARALRDAVAARTGKRCGLYASSIEVDAAHRARMEAAVAEILPLVDEHYWLPLYGQAGLTAGALGTSPVAGNVGRAARRREPLPCWALFTEAHITWDGRLAACCFDHDGRFDMGDLTVTSFAEAWTAAPFQALRRAHLARDVANTACETCIAWQPCAEGDADRA